jgi:electron transfer flavoprotein alpha subunit
MSVLVVAEHNDHLIDPTILGTVSAARQCSGDVHVLVAGALPGNAAKQASRIAGVSTVVRADAPVFRGDAADEALTTQIAALAPGYSSILLPASERGSMLASKVAERLGVRPIEDVTKVVHRNTAETEVHAGGQVLKVSRTGRPHVLTVRPSAFEAAAEVGGMASFTSMEAVV